MLLGVLFKQEGRINRMDLRPVRQRANDENLESNVESQEDEDGKVVLGKIARRTLQVSFKCDRCV